MSLIKGIVELRGPVRYDIDASEQEDGYWVLNYAEYFTEEDWNDAKTGSERIFDQMRGFADIKMDDSLRKAYFTKRASKNDIMNILAAEFLGFSQIGEIGLKDIFALVTLKLVEAGVFEKKKPGIIEKLEQA